MSAWPEAVWIVREVTASLNAEALLNALQDRVSVLEKKHVKISNTQPNGLTAGSLWLRIYN